MTKPTVLYNGACPVCRTEIEHYQRLDGDIHPKLAWRDINRLDGEPASCDPASCGIGADAMRRRLHVVDADGQLLVGVPAFARIWDHLPRYRWLARLVRLPLVRSVAPWLYEPLAAGLYAWDRHRRRSTPAEAG